MGKTARNKGTTPPSRVQYKTCEKIFMRARKEGEKGRKKDSVAVRKGNNSQFEAKIEQICSYKLSR